MAHNGKRAKKKKNGWNQNGGKKPIVEHHVIPKSRFKEKGAGSRGIKVKICSIFETAFHDLFWNMTIPEIIVFLIIIMYVRRDLKWSRNRLHKLRILILDGHFEKQTSVMEKMFHIDGEFLAENFRDKNTYCKNLPQH